MAAIQDGIFQWHAGEKAIHQLLNGPHYAQPNPTSPGLTRSHAYRVALSPLVAFGALDHHGRPWTTVLGGEPQFTRSVAPNVLGVQSLVDVDYDPVIGALFGGGSDDKARSRVKGDGALLRPGQDNGPVMAGLSIDLETRDRVKIAGKMLAGAVTERPIENSRQESDNGRVGEVQMAMFVQEALGNCPKYLNKKAIRPHVPRPRLLYDSHTTSGPLPQAGVAIIEKADLFFLSSTNGKTMDTNHRGGPPGFVRIAHNGETETHNGGASGLTLVYPEFSGNRLYQTLGNLQVKPLAGLLFPDFETGNVLYLTGHTEILVGAAASASMPRTKLAVRISVDQAILVAEGLPFRGDVIDYSPYNPPVCSLLSEIVASGGGDVDAAVAAAVASGGREPLATAMLTGREVLSPSVARFTFTLEPSTEAGSMGKVQWHAGQYVTLDFAPELDIGWSHMRDDDPQALNDDFVRTFTISSTPPQAATASLTFFPVSIELTLRHHGPATSLLWQHNLRVPLYIPVLAFGGNKNFRLPLPKGAATEASEDESVFIASGVGITPLLAQAPGLLSAQGSGRPSSLRVLWSMRAEDLPVAVDSFGRVGSLAERTTVFVTDASRESSFGTERGRLVQQLHDMGASVVEGRRIQKEDVALWARDSSAVRRKIYICTGAAMLYDLQTQLAGENLAWESFAF